MISNDASIEVLNYEGVVVIPSTTRVEGLTIPQGTLEQPSITSVSFLDIKTLNASSDLIRTGRLRFEPHREDEVYESLLIRDRENIFTDKEIKAMLKDNSLENLKRIGKLQSLQLVTRVKKYLFSMGVAGETIPNQVVTVLNERYEELRYNTSGKENSLLNRLIAENQEKEKASEMQNSVNEMMRQQKLIMEQMAKMQEENEKLRKELETTKQVKVENKTETKATKAKPTEQ